MSLLWQAGFLLAHRSPTVTLGTANHAMNLLFSNSEAASPAPPFTANCEPTLDEILEDPIVRQLMARDGVTEATLRRFADGMGESMVRGEQPR